MRSFAAVVSALLALGLGGCFGSDDEADESEAATPTRGVCPGGEEDFRVAKRDLGENPQGESTELGAVETFLRGKGGDATASDFEPIGGTQDDRKATFVYTDGNFELARLFVKQFRSGWLVISYEYCKGAL